MRARDFARDKRGNVAVEFALVLPLFLLLLMGLVDYGMAAHKKSTMQAAARAGLQALIEDPADTAEAETAAASVLGDADAVIDAQSECLCDDGTEIVCTNVCATGNRRRVGTVTITLEYSLMVPWPAFDDPLDLTAMAQARVQ